MRIMLEFSGDTPDSAAAAVLRRMSVPMAAALRYSEPGVDKYTAWQRTWNMQLQEDAGAADRDSKADAPPKYEPQDYLRAEWWRLRGKLDVPKERFISYPGCESDEDGEPVYGWAGWDHLHRVHALGALYLKRKDGEGWQKDRLAPMLAGLLELIPWVKQWHNEPSAEFGGLQMGDYFQQFLDGECRQLGLTHDDLRAWRPPKKIRAKTKAVPAGTSLYGGSTAPTPTKATRGRKKKTEATAPDSVPVGDPETS
jgi:hypothetical protein